MEAVEEALTAAVNRGGPLGDDDLLPAAFVAARQRGLARMRREMINQ